MACPEFEDRLIEYADIEGEARACVDTHLAECAGCRQFLEALRVVDTELTARFSGREASAAFSAAVLGVMAWWIVPFIPAFNASQAALSMNAALAAGGAFLLVALLIGLRSLA